VYPSKGPLPAGVKQVKRDGKRMFDVVDLRSGAPRIMSLPQGSPVLEELLRAARTDERVAVSESIVAGNPDGSPLSLPPAPPSGLGSWATDRLGVRQAHASGVTGAGVRVAVLDTGVEPHRDLEGRLVSTSMLTEGYLPSFWSAHGTSAAGIIAATPREEAGSIGIAPDAQIYSAQTCDDYACWSWANARAIIWAVDNGVDVINLSQGASAVAAATDTVQALLSWAADQGVLVAAAAGNDGCQPSAMASKQLRTDWATGPDPRCVVDLNILTSDFSGNPTPGVMSVGAIDHTDSVPTFSSFGPVVDIAGPGLSVRTLGQGYEVYGDFTGTSAATPHVAGVAALVKQVLPDASAATVQAILQASASSPKVTSQRALWSQCDYIDPSNPISPRQAVYFYRNWDVWPWTCSGLVADAVPQRHLTGAGIVDAAAAVSLAQSIADSGSLPAPTLAPSDTDLSVWWPAVEGATAYDVVVNGAAVTRVTAPAATLESVPLGESRAVVYQPIFDSVEGVESAPALVVGTGGAPPVDLPRVRRSFAQPDSNMSVEFESEPQTPVLVRFPGNGHMAVMSPDGPLSTWRYLNWASNEALLPKSDSLDVVLYPLDPDTFTRGAPIPLTIPYRARANCSIEQSYAPRNLNYEILDDSNIRLTWEPTAPGMQYRIIGSAMSGPVVTSDSSVIVPRSSRLYTGRPNYSVEPFAESSTSTCTAPWATIRVAAPAPAIPAPSNVRVVFAATGPLLRWDPSPLYRDTTVFTESGSARVTSGGTSVGYRLLDSELAPAGHRSVLRVAFWYRANPWSYQSVVTVFGSA